MYSIFCYLFLFIFICTIDKSSMDMIGFKQTVVTKKFGMDLATLSPIFSFIDFGNVNHWFEKDRMSLDGLQLEQDEKFVIDLEQLHAFADLFSMSSRFYYGVDLHNTKSVGFIDLARRNFGKHKVFSKPVQKIKHYINDIELKSNTRSVYKDEQGHYVHIPKCNFDVEICIDAIRLADLYKTFCLFSSDADFIRLCEYLKKQGKKIILIKGGFAQTHLIKTSDIVINAQDIKQYVTRIKQKSSL